MALSSCTHPGGGGLEEPAGNAEAEAEGRGPPPEWRRLSHPDFRPCFPGAIAHARWGGLRIILRPWKETCKEQNFYLCYDNLLNSTFIDTIQSAKTQ